MFAHLTCLVLVALAAGACTTMRGLGRDMSAAGDVVTDTAQGVQRGL